MIALKATERSPTLPKGSVGVVLSVPTDNRHKYLVKFPDGREYELRRQDLSIRKLQHGEAMAESPEALKYGNLHEYVIYRCLVGSKAYGLAHAESDEDRRGVYLPPANLQWSLWDAPEQLEDGGKDECYWELRKFIILSLKANPNLLECLYTSIVEYASELGQELREMRSCFLSKLLYQTYNGYALGQFKKMEQDLRARGQIKMKHAMHLVRLLLSGIHALDNGDILVDVGTYRERLLAIRNGETPWDEVNAWRLELHKQFEAAYTRTRLPERPDYAAANAFLIKARRSMVDK
jgi:predicted nucleotidyltransferase